MRGSFSKEVPSELRDKGLGLGEPGVSGLGMEWPKAVRIGPVCVCVCARMRAKSLQSCPALRDPRDYGPPGSSVHGTPQARILERVATALSRGSSQLRDGSTSLMPPALAGRLLSTSATWEACIGPKSQQKLPPTPDWLSWARGPPCSISSGQGSRGLLLIGRSCGFPSHPHQETAVLL